MEGMKEFLKKKLKEYRGTPLTLNELTESYFGRVKNKEDYRELWMFHRNKLRIAHNIRKLRKLTGLHIYSLYGKGYVIIEKEQDFLWLIGQQSKKVTNIQVLVALLRKDMNSTVYNDKINKFFGKLNHEEFNHMAKMKLYHAKLEKKRLKE